MPVISDKELSTYKEGLLEVERLTKNLNLHKIQSEEELEEVSGKSKKYKKMAIGLGILALLGIGSAAYFGYTAKKDVISLAEHQQTVQALEDNMAALQNEDYGDLAMNTIADQEVFAVQVGAFEEKDLSLYSESFVNFKEIRDEQYNKYALGNFESLEEARQFRQELVSLGLTDAFIGVYVNGERIRIEKTF